MCLPTEVTNELIRDLQIALDSRLESANTWIKIEVFPTYDRKGIDVIAVGHDISRRTYPLTWFSDMDDARRMIFRDATSW
jgi:hypothetical protein